MDKHRLAFRRALEKRGTFTARTIEGYVSASGRVVRLCREQGVNLYAGEVPEDLLEAIAEDLPPTAVRRVTRGAVLFLEFLAGRGIEVPPLDGAEAALSREQLDRFLAAAAEQPEPFACLFALLPMTGLSARDLSRLQLDDVTQDERGVVLRTAGGEVELGDDAELVLLRFLHDGRSGSDAAGSTVLFPSRAGRALSSSTITGRLQSVQKRAGLPSFRVSALSELFGVYFHASTPPAEDEAIVSAPDPNPPPDPPADRQPDLPNMTTSPALGSVPPDDDDEDEERPHLRLVQPPEELPLEPEPPHASTHRTDTDAHTDTDDDPQEDAPMDHDDDDDFDDDYEPAPRRRRRRSGSGRRRERGGGGARRIDPSLRKLAGKQSTVFIKWRNPRGKLENIRQYSVEDIIAYGSITCFVTEQLVPDYGAGDYEVYLDANDAESFRTITVAEPRSERERRAFDERHGEGSSTPGVWEIVRYFDERDRERHRTREPRRESFEEFYERKKMEEELERLRRENARLASGGGASLPGLPPLPPPELSPTERQLIERYFKLMDRQNEEAAKGTSDPLDQFESMMEFKRRFETVFGSGGGDERDFFDRMIEFLKTPFGEAMASRFMDKMPAPKASGPRRRGALGDAAKRPKKKRAKPNPSKRRPPQPRRQRPEEPRTERARPRDEEPDEPDGELDDDSDAYDDADEQEEPQRWAPSGVPAHFPTGQLAQAQTEDEVIEALLFALMCLNFDPRWRDAVQALLEATVADERDEALVIATAIAGALVHLGEMDRDTAELALHTVQKRWSTLRAQVLEHAAKETGPPSEDDEDDDDDG